MEDVDETVRITNKEDLVRWLLHKDGHPLAAIDAVTIEEAVARTVVAFPFLSVRRVIDDVALFATMASHHRYELLPKEVLS